MRNGEQGLFLQSSLVFNVLLGFKGFKGPAFMILRLLVQRSMGVTRPRMRESKSQRRGHDVGSLTDKPYRLRTMSTTRLDPNSRLLQVW